MAEPSELVTEPTVLTDAKGRAFEMRPIVCPTCGDVEQRFLGWRGGEHHRYGLGVATRVVRCEQCTLIFANPFPFPRDPQELYGDPEKYFERHDEARKVEGGRELLRVAGRRAGVERPSILDVGSGRGELVRAAQLEECEAVGLEFSTAMIDYARDRWGIELVAQTIEAYAAASDRTFDVVVLNAVLEHVYDPDAMIAAVAALLRPGGVLYVDVPQDPNLLTWIGGMIERVRLRRTVYNLAPTWPPYHVFGFSQRALRTLLAKHGIEIEELRVHARPDIPAGSGFGDRLRAFVGTQVNRVANATGTASNMTVWARRNR